MLLRFLCLFLFVGSINAQAIKLFSDTHTGHQVIVDIASCSNVPTSIAGKVKSLDTQDNCARLYDQRDCKGSSIEVMPRSPSHYDLSYWTFNGKTLSVGPCRDSCHPNITGPVPEGPLTITIYKESDFRGYKKELQVEGCTPIPQEFRRASNSNVTSVKTNGACFQLYNNDQCETEGKGADTIELRPGVPFHDDLKVWVFPESLAVSHCSYKCGRVNASTPTTTRPTTTTTATTTTTPTTTTEMVKIEETYEASISVVRAELDSRKCSNRTLIFDDISPLLRTDCFRLFHKENCEGDYIELIPRPRTLFNFTTLGFEVGPLSFGSCSDNDYCQPEVGMERSTQKRNELELFGRKNFKGPTQALRVDGCTLIPPGFREIGSVKTHETCFQFYINIQCATEGDGVDTLLLPPKAPFHHDFKKWELDRARAVSTCDYRCNQNIVETVPHAIGNLSRNEVQLFDEKNFQGNSHKLTLNVGECTDLSRDWEGIAESILVNDYAQSCFKLYDRKGCKGEELNVTSSQRDLSLMNFDGVARSLQTCETIISTEPQKWSVTTYNDQSTLPGQLIFQDEFEDFDTTLWSHYIGKPDEPFYFHVNNRSNSFVKDGILFMKPTFTEDAFGSELVHSGKLLFGTTPSAKCSRKPILCRKGESPIVHPIMTPLISSVNFMKFKYGKLQIRAKMPSGDWIGSVINLIPNEFVYGEDVRSGEISIGSVNGNRQLFDSNGFNVGVEQMCAGILLGAEDQPQIHNDCMNTEEHRGYDRDFHVYELEWTPKSIGIKIDDELVYAAPFPRQSMYKLWSRGSGMFNPWQLADNPVMAPFDQSFSLAIGVSVGDSSIFPDDYINQPYPKPWNNSDVNAAKAFWDARSLWDPTWEDDRSALQIDYIRLYSLNETISG